jgi:hypothetical protein
MKYLKSFEKKNKEIAESDTDIRTDMGKLAWELNAPYNWDAVPASDRKNYKWHPNVDMKEIEIGSADAVQRFQQWCGNYWAREENRFKRQDDGQCDTPTN